MTDNGDDKQEIADLRQQLNVLQQMLQNLHSTAKPSVINSVPAPEAFSFDKNEWTAWLTHYERYRITTKLDTADEKVQINSLLLHMGQKVTKILETKKKDEYSFDTYAEAKQFFTGYFVGTTNIIYARAKFNRRNQKEGESAQEYITAIVALGKDCKYGQLEDELVRDRLVVGIRDQKLSESLQLTEKLTLEMTVNKIMQAETIKTENQELREGVHIGAVKNKKPQKQKSSREQRNRPEKKNSTSFVWTEKHEEEFQNLKETIASAPVLAKYDVDKPTRVAADASAFGIGAVLEQQQNDDNWKPVYFCSKTLSDAEQRYAQIEKEALAATWACERLEQFLIGSRFLVLTDHKPLLVILTTKEINKLSNRLQRLRMRLLKFNYDVQYVPGKTFHVPDALSRAPLHEGDRDGDSALKDQEIYINAVLTELSSSSCSEEVVRKHQEEDQEMQLLKKFVVETWPGKPPTAVTPYFKFRNELKIHNNLICYRDRLVIPRALRKQCLRVLHDGHLGTPKCLEKAKTIVWWPEIRRHLKDMVENCETCIKHRQPVVEPMIPSTVPSRPWKVLGVDLAYYNGKNYLVVQDYYSKYPEIRKLKKLTSLETIEYLKDIFSHHGIPEELRSDNVKQFDSLEFRTFAKDYGFRWVSSSPEFQQSNGQAESAVKLLKTILKKNEDPFLGMLAYRNTPLSCGASPAQLLFGRQLRDRVPAISRRLVPKLPNHQAIRREMEAEKQRQKHHYDRRHRTKDNAELKAGDRVWLIHRKEEGMVQTPDETPRSYWVKTPHGQVRRNRQHLQKLPELGENPPRNSEPEIMSSPTNKQPKTPTPPVSARPNRTKKPPGRFKDFVID